MSVSTNLGHLQPLGLGSGGRMGAIVLAGGRGSRMGDGEPKPLRRLAGRALIAHVVDRLDGVSPVVINGPADGSFDAFGDMVVPDIRPAFQGPLAGIEAGLTALEETGETITHAIVVPADTPFLPANLVATMGAAASATEVVCAMRAGRLHPTVALWPLSLLSTLTQWLDDERRRALHAFFDHVGYRTVSFEDDPGAPGGDPFVNLNTPDDLQAAEAFTA